MEERGGERRKGTVEPSFISPLSFPFPLSLFPFLPEEKFPARRLLSPCANKVSEGKGKGKRKGKKVKRLEELDKGGNGEES